MSSFTSSTASSNLDNLLLQSLIGKLQIRPQNPLFPKSLDDLLLFSSASDDDNDDEDQNDDELGSGGEKTLLAKEESRLEKEIVRLILAGRSAQLRPNSGQAVSVGDHHICVGFHEEKGSEYRVWEWHGHIMLYDEDNGYTPEYIYGNYFERIQFSKNNVAGDVNPRHSSKEDDKEGNEENEKEKEKVVANLGLRELIDGGDGERDRNRVLHRNINAGSSSRSVVYQ